jgi:RNA polymerase sigma-70 factor (ECF subfamily)
MLKPLPRAQADDELALARRCAAGDRAAQHAFFVQQRAQVHRTLHRVLGSNRQVEDMIQDTFVAAFRSLGSFRGDSSLNTWVDTIATRVVYRELSRREPRAVQLHAVADMVAGTPDPERQADAREALRRLYAVLDHVEPKQRIAYTLHVVDGRSIKDVAQLTQATTLAVKNRIWRARQKVEDRAQRDPVLSELLHRLRGEP